MKIDNFLSVARYTYIHDTTVDVAKLLESEQTSSMSTVVEGETCRSINRNCSGILTISSLTVQLLELG